MKLTNMEVDRKREGETLTTAAEAAPDAPAYPWGLMVRLDNEGLDKLGIKALPDVDAEMTLVAVVKVSSVSSHESAGAKKPHRSVELQITDMALAPKVETTPAEDVLYKQKA